MKSSIIRVLSIAVGIVASSSVITQAHAVNLNVQGTVCQNFNAAQALDIDYLTSGVRNISSSSRQVICSAPRSPLPSGTSQGRFFIDGRNSGFSTISCTLSSFNFTGDFLGSVSFNTPILSRFDTLVTLPAAQLPAFAYTSLLCSLPGNGASVLYGITQVQ